MSGPTPEVSGWRYDAVSPVGIAQVLNYFDDSDREHAGGWNGWYYRARATCTRRVHYVDPPVDNCHCGINLVTEMTPEFADAVEGIAALRDMHPRADEVGVLLSRVTGYVALPGVGWDDPPFTFRCRRVVAHGWLCDNPALVDMIRGDDRLQGFPPVEYVSDLPAYIHEESDKQLDALLDSFLMDDIDEDG